MVQYRFTIQYVEYCRVHSIPTQNIYYPLKVAMCHAHIHHDHLYPTWELHSGACKDEIGCPLW